MSIQHWHALSNNVSDAFYSRHYHTIKIMVCLLGPFAATQRRGLKNQHLPPRLFQEGLLFNIRRKFRHQHRVPSLYFQYRMVEKTQERVLLSPVALPMSVYFTNHSIHTRETSLQTSHHQGLPVDMLYQANFGVPLLFRLPRGTGFRRPLIPGWIPGLDSVSYSPHDRGDSSLSLNKDQDFSASALWMFWAGLFCCLTILCTVGKFSSILGLLTRQMSETPSLPSKMQTLKNVSRHGGRDWLRTTDLKEI